MIALGFALGIGLVITVTAASAGVKNAQGRVLRAPYGVGTDVTVTQAPAAGSGGPFGLRIRTRARRGTTGASSGLPGLAGTAAFGPPGGGSGALRRLAAGASHTVTVHLTAPVTTAAVLLAVPLAIAGGWSRARSTAGGRPGVMREGRLSGG